MNNTNTVPIQQYINQENNTTPFYLRNLMFLGIAIPYWLIILCIVIIIIILIFQIFGDSSSKEVYPTYDFTVTSESPGNTVVDNILSKSY